MMFLLPFCMKGAGITIYYDNSATNWAKVHIHYWGGQGTTWPGVKMTQVNETVWKYTFPSSAGVDGVVFNDSQNSGGEQSADYKGGLKDGHIYKCAGGNKGAVTDEGEYDDNGEELPEVPTVKAKPGNNHRFSDKVEVTLTVTPEAAIYYTLDGTTPTAASTRYTSPITITESCTLTTYAITAENMSQVQTFKYTKLNLVTHTPGTNLITDYYKVNPDGKVGSNRTVNAKYTKLSNDNRMCVADNALTNWTEADLICQGVARDIASAFKGKHEYPVIDTYAIYAAYDATNLYLAVQYVYSVWDIYGDGKADNLRAKPYQMDGRIMIAFDLDPEKEFEGVLEGGNNTIWDNDGQYNKFNNGTDAILLCSTKSTSGVPGLFFPTPQGFASYDPQYCLGLPSPFYGCQDGLLPSINHIWGLYDFEKDPEELKCNDSFIDIIGEVPTSQHTVYEFTIPLSRLGITEDYIKNTGIGVMVIDTYGQGAIGATPYDPATFDNAKTAYSKDPSSSAEKEDLDIFTSPHARIGKLAPNAAIESVSAEASANNAPAEYFNLQGVRVMNPGPGFYIVRRGNTVSKELIR